MHSVQEPTDGPSGLRRFLRIFTGIALFCFLFLLLFADSRQGLQGIGTTGTILFGLLFLSLFVKRAI